MEIWGHWYSQSTISPLHCFLLQWNIHFCLWGGDEHRKLKLVQIQRDDTGYVYYENGPKNHKGTFSDRSIENKIVRSERVPEPGQRCHVHILDLYYSKCLQTHQQKAFHFRPKPKTPKEGPWYSSVPRTSWQSWSVTCMQKLVWRKRPTILSASQPPLSCSKPTLLGSFADV